MNLIFPLIAVLFVLCLITVHKVKKWILVTRQHRFQFSVTDKSNLSDHIEGQEQRPIFKKNESNHSISISCTMKGKKQKNQSAQEKTGESNENAASGLKISINFLK